MKASEVHQRDIEANDVKAIDGNEIRATSTLSIHSFQQLITTQSPSRIKSDPISTERSRYDLHAFGAYFVIIWLIRSTPMIGYGPFFMSAFIVGAVEFIVLFYLIFRRYRGSTKISAVEKQDLADDSTQRLNDILHTLNTIMICLYLLGESSSASTTVIARQSSDALAITPVLPVEQIMLLYLSQIICLVLLRPQRLAVAITWIITAVVVAISLWQLGDYIESWWILVDGILTFCVWYRIRQLMLIGAPVPKINRIEVPRSIRKSIAHAVAPIQKASDLPVTETKERTSLLDSREIDKKLSNALMHQMLPQDVAERIRSGQPVPPEAFDDVTVFFSDIKGFTNICAQVEPIEVVNMLNSVYTVMDYCCSLFPLYKVETIGDAYMVVGGLPERNARHVEHVANFAILVRELVGMVKSPIGDSPIEIRIGIHSGKVLAGVVGNLMPRYCLFGDTVNVCSRMESNGEAGKIHCSEATALLLSKTNLYNVSKRGELDIKGKGIMTTYWLDNAKQSNVSVNELAIYSIRQAASFILGLQDESPQIRGLLRTSFVIDEQEMTTPLDMNDEAAAMSPVAAPKARSRSVLSNTMRILVVEDSELQRKMMTKLLKSACPHWDIHAAKNGESALNKLKAAKFMFDVVVVDENLSEKQEELYGHELVKIMRTSLNMKKCVIIACLSNPKENAAQFENAGTDDIWQKPPPRPDVIYQKINALILEKAASVP